MLEILEIYFLKSNFLNSIRIQHDRHRWPQEKIR